MSGVRVFLSHSSRDKPLVRRINRRLRQCGAETFLDEQELEAGDDLPERFRREIERSSHVVVVWTLQADASPWVDREIGFARSVMPPNARLIPFLFAPPGGAVREIKGVDFSSPHGFEAAFAEAWRFIAGRAVPEEPPAAAEIDAMLAEAPAFAGLLSARRPEDLSALMLPQWGEADFWALDGLMWTAARRAGTMEAFLAYPGVFAKAFGHTAAGFEALDLLGARNDVNEKIFGELISADQVCDAALDGVIRLAERSKYPPQGWAWRFARAQRERLSPQQARRMFRFVELWGDTPAPGGPVDLLLELADYPALRAPAVDKLLNWLDRGLFDGAQQTPPRDSPHLFHTAIRALHKAGHRAEATRLAEGAYARIRRLYRSATDIGVLAAMRWVADGDRLPPDPAPYVSIIERASQDGVFSAEFEGWRHARAVAPLASALGGALRGSHESLRRQTMDEARAAARHGLAQLGLEPRL